MVVSLVRTVVRRNLLLLPPVRGMSREEAAYWLQMSKKQDVFPKQTQKFSKLEHFDEFGPLLPSTVLRTGHGHSKDSFAGSDCDGVGQVKSDDINNIINDTPFSDGEVLIPNYVGVSMLNQSRSNTSDVSVLDCGEIFKIGHIRNPSVPSVSKVLAATKSEESKAALARWEKEKIAVLGLAGFKQFKADMYARGHTLHSMLETYMETKQLPKASDVPDSVSKRHLVSISQAVRQFDNPLVLESAVTHPELNYCGIVDCVAMVGDTLALVDWKTSEKVKNNAAALYDNPLQVAAYIGAINSDERYKRLGNLTKGAVVVVYNSGYPAMVHMFDTQQMEMYWEQWCQRLQMFHNMN